MTGIGSDAFKVLATMERKTHVINPGVDTAPGTLQLVDAGLIDPSIERIPVTVQGSQDVLDAAAAALRGHMSSVEDPLEYGLPYAVQPAKDGAYELVPLGVSPEQGFVLPQGVNTSGLHTAEVDGQAPAAWVQSEQWHRADDATAGIVGIGTNNVHEGLSINAVPFGGDSGDTAVAQVRQMLGPKG
jgi:hypothetical protein